jgi:hypothetical protein
MPRVEQDGTDVSITASFLEAGVAAGEHPHEEHDLYCGERRRSGHWRIEKTRQLVKKPRDD